jgi:hypothetical protein
MRETGPFFLKCTGITELLLKDQDEGTVTLVGYLPDALELRKLGCGDVLEVVSRHHGLRREHTAEDVILRLGVLRATKRIPNLVALKPEEDMRLSLEVIADCKVTFLFSDRAEEA